MPGLFQELEGETCILVSMGVYRECPVFVRGRGELFAKASGGFIRLYASGATSKSKHRIDTLTITTLHKDKLGKLFAHASDETQPVTGEPKYLPYKESP